MIFDLQNLLSDKQAVTTGTQLSTNSLDLGVPGTVPGGLVSYGSALRDIGRGQPVHLLIQVNTTFTAGTNLTVNLVAGTGVDGNGQINAGTVVLQSSGAILEATLLSGYQFRISGDLPPGNSLRYLGVQYVTTGTHSTGTITAGIVADHDTNYAPI
jgi:hypothetical protein